MSRSKFIASELRRFRDSHEEYRETRDKRAGVEMHRAMSGLSPENFRRAQEEMVGQNVDQHNADQRLLRECKFSGFEEKSREVVPIPRRRRQKKER